MKRTPLERLKHMKEKGVVLFPGLTPDEKRKVLYISLEEDIPSCKIQQSKPSKKT